MDGIIPRLRFAQKQKLFEHLRRCRNPGLKLHYLIVVNLVRGRSARQTADVLVVGLSTVYRVAHRFGEEGEVGLLDRREDNGEAKLDEQYLAGALDAVTGQLIWVEAERKNSGLFIALLEKLAAAYPKAKVIHVILDNYRIHTSQITRTAVRAFGGRIVLHFLPPYCPNDNKIERVWEDLHAQVTRNHCCPNIKTLMQQVRRWLRRRARTMRRTYVKKAA